MSGAIAYSGLRVLLTGASSGIGAALARELSERGARVALVARRRERLEALASELGGAAGRAVAIAADVGEPEQAERAVAEAERAFGGVDLLVNNAGFAVHARFTEHSAEEIRAMLRTNLLAAADLCQRVLPGMRRAGRGWIVNVSSFAALMPQVDESVYSASKAALSALSEVLHHELAPEGIHVLVVHPVLVESEMFTPEVMARMPKGTARNFITAPRFARDLLAALERGERSVVIPPRYAAVPLVAHLLPGPIGRALAARRLGALPPEEG